MTICTFAQHIACCCWLCCRSWDVTAADSKYKIAAEQSQEQAKQEGDRIGWPANERQWLRFRSLNFLLALKFPNISISFFFMVVGCDEMMVMTG